MAETIFANGLLFCGRVALQAQIKEMALVISSELQDTTAYDDSARNRLGGLKDVSFSAAGYFGAAEPDFTLYSDLGVADELITVTPTTNLGDRSYFFRAVLGEYSPIGGEVGAVAGFSLNAAAYFSDLIRGTLMENGSFLVTGNGTGRQLGAVAANQRIHAGIHVTGITGDWTIIVESDDNGGFSSPTTRMTFANITSITDLALFVAGSITDDFWRLRFVENSAGTITLAASLGIQ